MARQKRVWIPDCYYHIVSRGNRRDPLFMDKRDISAFYHILNRLYLKLPFELPAFCLMTNHYHFLLRSQQSSISTVMAFINKRYANYYNTRYNLTGHVFEKRFFSKVIKDRANMLEVSRYIHLNPVRAEIVTSPKLYPHSSYPFYIDSTIVPPAYINPNVVLDLFSGTIAEKRNMYSLFIGE